MPDPIDIVREPWFLEMMIQCGFDPNSGGGTPGGAAGDVQFNDGAGGFTNADGVFSGYVFAINPSTGELNLTSPNGKDLILFGGQFLELIANNGVLIGTQPGNEVDIQTTFAAGLLNLGNSANPVRIKGSICSIANLQVFANNADAIAGGLAVNDLYRTGADPDTVCVVH